MAEWVRDEVGASTGEDFGSAVAAEHLCAVQRICQQHGERALWDEIIQGVRSQYSDLPRPAQRVEEDGVVKLSAGRTHTCR